MKQSRRNETRQAPVKRYRAPAGLPCSLPLYLQRRSCVLVGCYGRDARTSLWSGEHADMPRILFFENTLVLTGA